MSNLTVAVGRRIAAVERGMLAARRRLPIAGPAESALLVPVRGFDAVLDELRARHGLEGTPGIPAHVTVLYPFVAPRRVPGALRSLREIVGRVDPFSFTLAAPARFPGVLYATPEPAEPFVALTEAIVARWPWHPPYRGRFPDIVPHCTIAESDAPAAVEDDVRRVLPFTAVADELMVATETDGGWRCAATLAFRGTGDASG